MPQANAAFEIRNSPLSENATVGFEFGYNVQEPGRLVLWEAQYGDFINGALVILDEYVTSGRAKWGLTPSLVLLLPHGYEGAGPDHSSARPERFLGAAADINLRFANCTTAAQYFHLLRRQALLLKTDPLPLIVLTPKSLLRHGATASSLRELTEGRFMPVLDDPDASTRARDVRRLVLCTGKVYVDLVSSPRRAEATDVAIARIEQLYPYPGERAAGAAGDVSAPARSGVAAGRTAEHGVLGVPDAAAARNDRQEGVAHLRGPSAQREPVGRLVGVAHDQPAAAGRGCVRRKRGRTAHGSRREHQESGAAGNREALANCPMQQSECGSVRVWRRIRGV